MKVSRNAAVGWTALLAAGVIGGVTAVALTGHQPSRDTIVRNVSDEGEASPSPSAPASADPAAAPSPSSSTAPIGTDPTVDAPDTTPANPATGGQPEAPAPAPADAPAPAPNPAPAPAPEPAPTASRAPSNPEPVDPVQPGHEPPAKP